MLGYVLMADRIGLGVTSPLRDVLGLWKVLTPRLFCSTFGVWESLNEKESSGPLTYFLETFRFISFSCWGKNFLPLIFGVFLGE